MNDSEKNKEIAKILGFRVYENESKDAFGWLYPKKYRKLQSVEHEKQVPDFILLIDEAIKLTQSLKSNYIKSDFGSRPTLNDYLNDGPQTIHDYIEDLKSKNET